MNALSKRLDRLEAQRPPRLSIRDAAAILAGWERDGWLVRTGNTFRVGSPTPSAEWDRVDFICQLLTGD